MNMSEEQGEVTPVEVFAAESGPSNNGSRVSDGEQSPSPKKRDASQNTKLAIQKNSTIRTRKGGGPRTTIGKERSKSNSVKHGIFSNSVLLEQEPREQFGALLKGLRTDLLPEGTLEGILVEKLASLLWRYRRMLRAERAEIRFERRFQSSDRERHKQEAAILFKSMESGGPGLITMTENPVIRERCLDLLEALKTMIEIRAFNPPHDDQILRLIFGDGIISEFRMIYDMCHCPGTFPKEFKEFDLPPEERKVKFLGFLNDEIERIKNIGKVLDGCAAWKEKLKAGCAQVPQPATVDRLLRYETTLNRAIEKTLNQLERLQRIRKGQPVAPTLNVNLSQ